MEKEAIQRLQRNLGLSADGVLGPATYQTLFSKFCANVERCSELALAANAHFKRYGIEENASRFMHFMAQVLHESGHFRYMEEIASGSAYEGRKDLGNVCKGDGCRYKGRGPIQLTGRHNYKLYGQALGFDFEKHPEIVAVPSVGLLVACKFWSDHGLNTLADQNKIELITKKINGGLNGFEDRKMLFEKMRKLLS